MRFNKNIIIYSISAIIFLLLLFLPKIIDLIPSNEMKFLIIIIMYLLVFIFMVFETYLDIRKKTYTTNKYIVLVNFIVIIDFLFLGYISFNRYDITDAEALLSKNNFRIIALLIFYGAILVRSLLRSQRFKNRQSI